MLNKNQLVPSRRSKITKEEIWKENMEKKWEMIPTIMIMMLGNRAINEFNQIYISILFFV